MCLESPLLLNAVSACATVDLHKGAGERHVPAQKFYMAAISEISAGITNRTLTGREDHLLATVIWLCVFENSRVGGREYNAIHAAALRRILLLRGPMDLKHASTAELIWERMCVESYIYHNAVTTLFDGRPDLIDDTYVVLEKFQNRISPSADSAVDVESTMSIQPFILQSPVLGAPYHMFLALMQGIKLLRTSDGNSDDCALAWSHYYNVRDMHSSLETICKQYGDSRRWIGRLYATAIRLLFLHFISSQNENGHQVFEFLPWHGEMTSTVSEAKMLLKTMESDIDRTWGKFFLWPLAIFYGHWLSLGRSYATNPALLQYGVG